MKLNRRQRVKTGILALTVFGFVPNLVFAAEVLINEVAWMGSEASYSDEWIELYNNGDSAIDLAGWMLNAADGSPEIQLTGIVLPKNFYLLERTDDDTVPDAGADLIYKGSLSNNGESLRLHDSTGAIIDAVEAASGWFAGDNVSKQTMERIIPDSWQTSQLPGGTPKSENGSGAPEQRKTLPAVRTENQSAETSPAPPQTTPTSPAANSSGEPAGYPDGIILNEILPSPEGSDAEEEWIEVFNMNNFEADLSGWQISDTVGSIAIYTFPIKSLIMANGFLVLSRPDSGITLNNGGDGLQLKRPDGSLADQVSFPSAPKNQSYNRGQDDWEWSSTLTPGNKNILASAESRDKSKEGSVNNFDPGELEKTALAKLPRSQGDGKLPISLIALALAFFAGIAMVILKIKIKG